MVLAAHGLMLLAAHGLIVWAAHGLMVLAAQGLMVLAAQGLIVLAAHGFTARSVLRPVDEGTELTARTTTNPPTASNISGRTIFLNMGFLPLKSDLSRLGVPVEQQSQHTLVTNHKERLALKLLIFPLRWPHITLDALQCWGRPLLAYY